MNDKESDKPEISVVIATYNRCHSLSELLDSLARQRIPTTQFEIVVANDGSTDGTAEMLVEQARNRPNLRVVHLPNGGPGAARNAGAKAARGKYLAFTDDDCLASDDWLQNIRRTFEHTGAVGVQGRTTTDRMMRSPLTHQVEVLKHWPAALPTCNAAYRRDVFVQVGGFDSGFKYAHNEDADLAWRVEECGQIVFASDVHIVHPPRRDRFWKRVRWVLYLESDFYLFYKNPEKYRKYISASPWVTIYWKVFVWEQLELVKLSMKCVSGPVRPHDACGGLVLVVARWLNMIRLFPKYWRAQRQCRARVQRRKDDA